MSYGTRIIGAMKREYEEASRRRRQREEIQPLKVRDYSKLRADLQEAAEQADTTLKAYRRELQR